VKENRFSHSLKTAQDSVRSPLLASLLKIPMHLAFLVEEHVGGTAGTMAWPGRRCLKTVELSPFSSCWEHGDGLASASPATQLNLSLLALGLAQARALWCHRLTVGAAVTELVCPFSAAARSSCKFLHQISWDAFGKHFLRDTVRPVSWIICEICP